MTLTKSIEIENCRKRFTTYAFVDLSEEGKLGQHPNRATQWCNEAPLERDVQLIIIPPTRVVIDNGTEVADVGIICPESRCPFHMRYFSY